MDRRTFLSGMATVSTVAIVGAVAAQLARSAQPSTLHTIEITEFRFSPSALNVRKGDRVKWINLDIVPHTATALNSNWDTGELKPNESAEIVVHEGHNGPYFCAYHPMMKAGLTVN